MKQLSRLWRAAPLSLLMTACAVLAEAVSNGLRAYHLGESLSHFTVATAWEFKLSLAGAVLVAGAAAISVYQAKFATFVLTSRVTSQRWIAAPFLIVCLIISGASMVSHVLEAQRAKGSSEKGARGTFDRTEHDYYKLKGEIDGLGTPRSPDVINNEIRKLKIPASVWSRSNQCTDITRDDTREACAPVADLRIELGNWERKVKLEPQMQEAKRKLDNTERPAELPWLDQWLAFAWPWVFGTGVVLVATFGYAVAMMQARPELPGRDQLRDTPPRGGVYTKLEAERDLVTLIALNGRVPSQEFLRKRWGLKSKGTVSKWMDAWEEAGLVSRAQDGRCKAITAA